MFLCRTCAPPRTRISLGVRETHAERARDGGRQRHEGVPTSAPGPPLVAEGIPAFKIKGQSTYNIQVQLCTAPYHELDARLAGDRKQRSST